MGKKKKAENGSGTQMTEKETRETKEKDPEAGKSEMDRDPVQVLEEKLDEAKQEAAQTYDRFLRVAADFDNYKKRTTREMNDLRKYANEALLKDLLSAVDNLERAVHSSNDSENHANGIIEGVHMTLKELLKILEKYQVKPIEAVGKTFDPAFHQAFMTEESEEYPENTVLKEFQKGYTLHDRLLRPAMVVVSKGVSAAGAPEEAKEEN